MKKLLAAITIVGLASLANAQTDAQLRADGTKAGNPENVLTYGMGYHQNRYSPLNQINKSNVKRLVPVWSTSLDNELGEQAQPLHLADPHRGRQRPLLQQQAIATCAPDGL